MFGNLKTKSYVNILNTTATLIGLSDIECCNQATDPIHDHGHYATVKRLRNQLNNSY